MAKPHVQGQKCAFHTLYLHSFEQFPAKVQTGGWSCHRPFVSGIYGMEPLFVYLFRFFAYPSRKGNLPYTEKRTPELFVCAVVQKPERPAPRSGIVYNLCNKRVILSKIESITADMEDAAISLLDMLLQYNSRREKK